MVHSFRSYFLITCGGLIQGIGMALFLFPHSIPSGGAGGLAVLLNYWINIPLSFALWLVNFSMLVAAIYWLGNASAIGTMYGITITSLSVHLFSFDWYRPYNNVWVDLVIGSIILGIGVGLLLRQGVSNGGMGVIALIIAKVKEIAPGKPLFLLNGSIFIVTGSIIAWPIVVQALISQWLSTKMVDIVFRLKSIFIIEQPLLGFRKKKNNRLKK
ncbi:YitT family protein [Alkalihalobacillus sp. MEB130]|uniref:YitT family protein n=1 Tax=Alkalihalobacillus sp. MEB130 TaxID=2976704 RepID=UPI0028E07C0E|nr:YitT family protein [Alkalihalobacillus sp. MEB130]MDT8861642.1 YitT family protein [Alkalihalobacillus sp. MEB130]